MMRLLLLSLPLISASFCGAATLFSRDYEITGLGEVDQIAFSTDIPLGSLVTLTTVELELSHSYAGEFVLTLRSPTGAEFLLLDHDGARTRIGAGNGLLGGVEVYTLIAPEDAVSTVVEWDFTGYQPGGIYGAREWPAGSWDAGVWNLTLFNDDTSFAENGVVGNVSITGQPIPEPSSSILVLVGGAVLGFHRRRSRGEQCAELQIRPRWRV